MAFWKQAAQAFAPVFRPTGNTIPGVMPGDWASPQNPIRVVRQQGVGVRSWDFTPGINLQFTPRGDTKVSFGQLWNVSNSFDLCRLMIETRKDQVVNRPWTFSVPQKPGESKQAHGARQSANPDVALLNSYFERPDGAHTFDLWIRMWLEQLLVFDAPTLYPVRNVLGDVIVPSASVYGGFRVISGTTITPLLDAQGFRPCPPAPAYQQIILGSPTGNLAAAGIDAAKGKEFTADQLVYSPRNPRVDSRWGFSPVEQIIVTLSIASNRQQFLRDYYTSGNVPEGLLPMPETWTMTQIKDFQTWFDSMLAGNLGKRRRMIMIPETQKGAQFSKDKALTDTTDDYLTRVVAFAFSITPQNLIKQVNRGTAQESSDVAQIEGLEPVLKHVENVMNELAQIVRPGTEARFGYIDEREMDPVKQSTVDDNYIKSGTYSRNEIRIARGDDPRPEAGADALLIQTTTGAISIDDAVTQGSNQAAAAGQDPNGGDDDPDGGGPGGSGGGSNRKVIKGKPSMRMAAGALTAKSRIARQEATRILARFLPEQGRRVAKQAGAAFKKAMKLRKDGDLETDTDRALAILAAIEWQYPELYALLRPQLVIAAQQGAQVGAYQVAANAGAPLDAVLKAAEEAAVKAAEARAAEMVGLKVGADGALVEDSGARWAISSTSNDDVLSAIRQGLREGWTSDQLEAVIQASTVFSEDHAELIGDNEIVGQQSLGHLQAWWASGKIKSYHWQTMDDGGCCEICIGFQELGSVKAGYVFAPYIYAPGAHPWCRCWLVIDELNEEELAA